jgi:hypothetical protein
LDINTEELPQRKRKEKKGNKKEGKEIIIPTEIDFLNYCKTIEQFDFYAYQFSLKSKYEAWVSDGWKDGNGNEISNWKTKIKNTIPFLKPTKVVINTNPQVHY